MKHVLQEVASEVDREGKGCLDLTGFERLMDTLRAREGFTNREFDDFTSIYRRFDRDSSGEIDSKELIGILNWLGYSFEAKDTSDILKEVDVDGSGSINDREFMM